MIVVAVSALVTVARSGAHELRRWLMVASRVRRRSDPTSPSIRESDLASRLSLSVSELRSLLAKIAPRRGARETRPRWDDITPLLTRQQIAAAQERRVHGVSRRWIGGCPKLVAEWHPTKNGTLMPWEVSYGSARAIVGSARRVWWRCSHGPDHEWRARIFTRTVIGAGCPGCAGRKLSVTSSLIAIAQRSAVPSPRLPLLFWKTRRQVEFARPQGAGRRARMAPDEECATDTERCDRRIETHGLVALPPRSDASVASCDSQPRAQPRTKGLGLPDLFPRFARSRTTFKEAAECDRTGHSRCDALSS